MRRIFALLAVSSLVSLFGCVDQTGSDAGDESDQADVEAIGDKVLMPTVDSAINFAGPSGQAASQITYHGGPVMTGGTNIYYIWYGNWSGNTAVSILNNLANNIGASPYYNINTTYTNGSGQKVGTNVTLAGSTTDNYSKGTRLTDSAIKTVVTNAINSGALGPADTNGLYFLLTSADVTASSGFCTKYCGWHTHASIGGKDIKYSFVGNPDRCPSSCSMQQAPNGNAGADGMASILAHELEETATDEDLNAWYDGSGYENADKCAWTFGTVSGSSGSQYNMTIGGMKYLIQQNWVNSGAGYCAVSY